MSEKRPLDDNSEKDAEKDGVKRIRVDLSDIRCPITHEIFWEPVSASDGHIYERAAIEEHMKRIITSPITREKLTPGFHPCRLLKNQINELLTDHPELQKDQYDGKSYYDFALNKDKCISFIEQRKYGELRRYRNFALTGIIGQFHKTLGRYLCEIYGRVPGVLDVPNDIIQHVFENSIDINVVDDEKFRPVEYLCITKRFSVVWYLMKKDMIEWKNDAMLHYACECNKSLEFVKSLVEEKEEKEGHNLLCVMDKPANLYPIEYAFRNGCTDTTIYLANKMVETTKKWQLNASVLSILVTVLEHDKIMVVLDKIKNTRFVYDTFEYLLVRDYSEALDKNTMLTPEHKKSIVAKLRELRRWMDSQPLPVPLPEDVKKAE